MRYVQPVFRPPSEGGSYILQATIGCSNNTCTFCPMYKTKDFQVRELSEIMEDIDMAIIDLPHTRRVFIADGDAMAMDATELVKIIKKLWQSFPRLERVGIYATPGNLLAKTEEDLKALKEAGLGIVYLGVESGSEKILQQVAKCATPQEMKVGALKAINAGLKLSVTIILGLGGKEMSQEHAKETGKLLSEMNPHYLGALTLMVDKGTPIHKRVKSGELTLLNSAEILQELKVLVEHLDTKGCIFRSNHASNYLPLKGVLKEDKEELLAQIEGALKDPALLRSEDYRGL